MLFSVLLLGLAAAQESGQPTQPVLPAAPADEQKYATFGQQLSLQGKMERSFMAFKDGFGVTAWSPSDRMVTVTTNNNPLGASFVTGATGSGFEPLQQYSYVVKTSDNAQDLIGTIELPYDSESLEKLGFSSGETYVGKLSEDRLSWKIVEYQQNVHKAANRTRLVQMTSLDGEYRLLGRREIDSGNIYKTYGWGERNLVNVTGGPGVEEVEFIDGLRFSVMSPKPAQYNANIKYLDDEPKLPGKLQAVYSYSWIVNSTVGQQGQEENVAGTPALRRRQSQSTIQGGLYFPINTEAIQSRLFSGNSAKTAGASGGRKQNVQSVDSGAPTITGKMNFIEVAGACEFAVVHRSADSGHNDWTVLAQTDGGKKGQAQLSLQDHTSKAQLSGMSSLDGEYLLAVKFAGKQGSAAARKSTSGAASAKVMGWSTAALAVGVVALVSMIM